MSVLIKDMKMPEDCFGCQLKEEGFCNITNAYAEQIYKRNSDCPLVEIPEKHGELIDRDALKKMSYEVKDNIGYVQVVNVWDIDRELAIVGAQDE